MFSLKTIKNAASLFLVLIISLANAPDALSIETGVYNGELEEVSLSFNTMMIKTQMGSQVFKFSDTTKIKNSTASNLNQLRLGTDIEVNYTRLDGQMIADVVTVKPHRLAPGELLTTYSLEKLLSNSPVNSSYTLIDTRPRIRYEQGHIQYAKSLPLSDWDELKQKVLPPAKNDLIVFYCSGETCALSSKAASLARQEGYTNIKVYVGGISAWRDAGKTLFTRAEFLNRLIHETEKDPTLPPSFVLLDLRSPVEVSRGHIPYATEISPQAIIDGISKFPADKKARIIFYGQSGPTTEGVKAMKALYKANYHNTSCLEGGFDGWLKAGFSTKKGNASGEINFVRKLEEDEISLEDFKNFISAPSVEKIILDVRSEAKFSGGSLPGARNVPFQNLHEDFNKLPLDKEILVYCSTGATSQMASQFLKRHGYRSRYLNAYVKFGDDQYTIEP